MASTADQPLFSTIAFIGVGLIGGSLALACRKYHIADKLIGYSHRAKTRKKITQLDLVDQVVDTIEDAVSQADLVVIATPLGTFQSLGQAIAPHLQAGTIITDVGSTKQAAIDALKPHLPDYCTLVPTHPIAGTEHSGPSAAHDDLLSGHWCILTPDGADAGDHASIHKVEQMYQRAGMMTRIMTAKDHDHILAITSHLPHLIAFTIVDTAVQLSQDIKNDVISFSAGGFRDFTRIAASDPTMWRDIFLSNRVAVLDILERFDSDLKIARQAIKNGDGDALFELFQRTRDTRRQIIAAGQD